VKEEVTYHTVHTFSEPGSDRLDIVRCKTQAADEERTWMHPHLYPVDFDFHTRRGGLEASLQKPVEKNQRRVLEEENDVCFREKAKNEC
jgi:hypothetical protein